MLHRIVKAAFGAAVAVTLVVGTASLFAPVRAAGIGGGCICPDVYAPVTCSNGRTYSNSCVASCNKAKNCVPTGGI